MGIDKLKVWYFVALVIAVILHEISHGVVALWFGDDTAKRAGRLTLNPIPHLDPFGSVILPALGAISGIPVICWAKPVPVNPGRLRHTRRDMLIVSLAGPATNFTLMALAAIATRVLYNDGASETVLNVVFIFALVNLLLAVFNFLPIPPLDGASLIERALPESWLPGWYRFRPYGIAVLFLLIFVTPFFDWVFDPLVRLLRDFVTG